MEVKEDSLIPQVEANIHRPQQPLHLPTLTPLITPLQNHYPYQRMDTTLYQPVVVDNIENIFELSIREITKDIIIKLISDETEEGKEDSVAG